MTTQTNILNILKNSPSIALLKTRMCNDIIKFLTSVFNETTAISKENIHNLLADFLNTNDIDIDEEDSDIQITDIYAECSTDYDRNAPTTKDFYASIQNRFHYAITEQTAAEIIYSNADHSKEHMGLKTWKNAPDGRILKSDVSIAKNYLPEKEIKQLERAVAAYFDYIENQIERHNAFTMEQFAASVDKFLTFNDYKILPDKGRISAAQAKEKTENEYDIFNKTQRIDSDFDKQVRGMLGE